MIYLRGINPVEKGFLSVKFIVDGREYSEVIEGDESVVNSKVLKRAREIRESRELSDELYVREVKIDECEGN